MNPIIILIPLLQITINQTQTLQIKLKQQKRYPIWVIFWKNQLLSLKLIALTLKIAPEKSSNWKATELSDPEKKMYFSKLLNSRIKKIYQQLKDQIFIIGSVSFQSKKQFFFFFFWIFERGRMKKLKNQTAVCGGKKPIDETFFIGAKT